MKDLSFRISNKQEEMMIERIEQIDVASFIVLVRYFHFKTFT